MDAILIVFGSGFIVIAVVGIIHRSFERPSDFAAGVARSLREDSPSWDYHTDETWIISHKAALEISLQYENWGRVNTRQAVNSGSTQIITFKGADRRTFSNALQVWREKTAIDRAQIAERRKREAMLALAA